MGSRSGGGAHEALSEGGSLLSPSGDSGAPAPMIGLSVFPSQRPFFDALAEAARQDADVLLISNRIVMLSQSGADILSGIGLARLASMLSGASSEAALRRAATDQLPVLRAVAAAPRAALVALLFPHAPARGGARRVLLLPYAAGARASACAPAVRFARLTSPADAEVHVVRADGGAAPGEPADAPEARRARADSAPPTPTLAHATPAFRVAADPADAAGLAPPADDAAPLSLDARPNTRFFSAAGRNVPDTLQRVLHAHPNVYGYVVLSGVSAAEPGGGGGAQTGSPRGTVPEDSSIHAGQGLARTFSLNRATGGGSGSSSGGGSPLRSRRESVDETQGSLGDHFQSLADSIAVCAANGTSVIVVFPPTEGARKNL